MCVGVCVGICHLCAGAQGGQKRALGCLELESVSCELYNRSAVNKPSVIRNSSSTPEQPEPSLSPALLCSLRIIFVLKMSSTLTGSFLSPTRGGITLWMFLCLASL